MDFRILVLFAVLCSSYNVLALAPNGVCLLQVDVGPCKALFRRYFYNTITQKCQQFYYGGCAGNANNFANYQECQKTCLSSAVPQICRLPKKKGRCKARIPQYFFNMITMQCELFYYGGCHGNANRFQDLTSCKQHCTCAAPRLDNIS